MNDVVRRLGGGDLNDAFEVRLPDGRQAFAKSRDGAAPGEYATEAASLRWLAEPGALRVPAVLAATDERLTLEWVKAGRLDAAGEEELGRGLAALHASGAPAFGALAPGAPGPLRLGPLELSAPTAESWPRFYAEHRLAALADRAGLSPAGRGVLERVCERIDELAGPAEPPARLHGDLWSGNVLAGDDGRPWLIDPAAYGGHREVDLAMLRLFGGPGERCFAAYEEATPLASGHEDRVGLWQLFPLLVHAVLFGGGYASSVERIARRYADAGGG